MRKTLTIPVIMTLCFGFSAGAALAEEGCFALMGDWQPREAVVNRKKQTQTLPGMITGLRSTLRRQLDRQMTTFKRSSPEFYAGYIAARGVVDRAGRTAKKPAPAPAPKPA